MASMIHPVIAPADTSTMSLTDILFFTDEPAAQRAAYADFVRARQIETRNAEIGEYMTKHRDRLLAALFTEQAAAVMRYDAVAA